MNRLGHLVSARLPPNGPPLVERLDFALQRIQGVVFHEDFALEVGRDGSSRQRALRPFVERLPLELLVVGQFAKIA
jgi:hypothetical protein